MVPVLELTPMMPSLSQDPYTSKAIGESLYKNVYEILLQDINTWIFVICLRIYAFVTSSKDILDSKGEIVNMGSSFCYEFCQKVQKWQFWRLSLWYKVFHKGF